MIRSEELLMLNYLNSFQIKIQFITLFTSRCQSDNEETHQGQPESKDCLAGRESKQRNPNDRRIICGQQGSWAHSWLEVGLSSGHTHVLLDPLQNPVNPTLGSVDGSTLLHSPLPAAWGTTMRQKARRVRQISSTSASGHLYELSLRHCLQGT